MLSQLFLLEKGGIMTFEDDYFKQKRLNPEILEAFGFRATDKGWELRKPLIDQELEARLLIDKEGI